MILINLNNKMSTNKWLLTTVSFKVVALLQASTASAEADQLVDNLFASGSIAVAGHELRTFEAAHRFDFSMHLSQAFDLY